MYSSVTVSYGNDSGYGSSSLERMVAQYSVEAPQQINEMPTYGNGKGGKSYGHYRTIAETQPFFFLSPQRPQTPFVGKAAEIAEHIRQAFVLTTGEELPRSITITVASRAELLQKNLAFLSSSVVGISINRTQEVFAAAGSMDEVMLAIGHELGHVITEPARTPREEEAKAFAFEAAWAKAIFAHDIAGLRNSINAAAFSPAKNGLHDVASNFVKNNSSEPLQLFKRIVSGEVSSRQILEGTGLQPATAVISAKALSYSPPQQSKTKLYGGYQNKSRVQNLPPPHNFFWADIGKGIYGIYFPLTQAETLNSQLLRSDIEQMHKTMGHEYSLHHVMGLPDGYVAEALEDAMFWTAEDDDKYYPKKN